MGNTYAQSVVDFGTDLQSTKYYESMNAANPPAGEWYAVDYDDSSWSTYTNPLDFPEYDAFWVRRTFFITDDPASHSFQLKLAHDDGAFFYINGKLIHSDWGCCGRYNYYDVPSEYLVNGTNVLAVYVIDTGGDQCLECFISATDGSDIIFDLPIEPTIMLLKSNIRLYYGVTGYSDYSLNARLLTPTGFVDNAQLSWTSSNPDVVSVTDGHVVSLSGGNAIVTASVIFEGVTYTKECAVEVRAIAPGSKFVEVSEAGTLSSLLTDDEKNNTTSLTVVGNLNSDDMSVLSSMSRMGKLADLDIYETSLQTIDWYTFNDCSSLISIVLPVGLTRIGEYAFEFCNSLTSIVFPDALTSIEWGAFYYCSSLTSIDLPNGITSIKGGSFSKCTSLVSIVIPASVTSIGESAFYGCSSLTSIILPDGLTSIERSAFYGCSALTSIVIPNGITNIGEETFRDCITLASIILPDGISNIERFAFAGCSSLASIEIPNYIMGIGEYAFYGCSSLSSIELPAGLTSIGGYAFYGCSSLTSILLPDGITSIDYYTFSDCSSLTSVVFPAGITNIGYYAFKGCSSLTSIELPVGLTSIEYCAFKDCSSLTSIKFPVDLTSIDFSAFEGCSSLTSIVLPDGLTSIGESAFTGCSLLTSIDIPVGVTNIGGSTFSGCNSLTSIVLPDGITSIGGYAFYNCSLLTSINLPEGLTSIGSSAFYGCSSLTTITIPSTLTEIGYDIWNPTFGRCFNLKEIIIKSPVIADNFFHYFREGSAGFEYEGQYYYQQREVLMPTVVVFPEGTTKISNNSFSGIRELQSFTIPSTVTVIEDNAFNRCSSLTALTLPGGVTSIGNNAFYECSSLTLSDFPAALTSLGEYAFSGCSALTSINIPDGLTSIEGYAFSGCSSLTSISLPVSVTSIGEFAFSGCSSLASIVIPEGLTSIEDYSFYNCSSLTSVAFPDGLTSIEDYSFYNCSSLTSVAFPDGLTSIGGSAFRDCSSLISLIIPNGVTCIKDNTFGGCKSLKSVTLPEGITSIEYSAFDGCTSLLSMVIPEGVTNIDYRAFYNCSSLKYLSLPSTINTFYSDDWGAMPFRDCMSLDTIIIKSQYVADNYSRFLRENTRSNPSCVVFPEGITAICDNAFLGYNRMESFIIPKSVTSIGIDAFNGCSSLSSIDLPKGITSIGGWAFYGCSSLTEIDLPVGVVSIGNGAFCDCISLQSISLPEGIDSLGSSVFYGCKSLESITIPSTLRVVEYDENELAFGDCFNLKTIIIKSPVIADDFYNIFRGGSSYGYLYDSYGSYFYDFWENGPRYYNWRNILPVHVEFPEGTTKICDNAFIGCNEMESFIIPSTVKSIGSNAFAGCSSLTSLVISESVESIGENALTNIDCYFESDVPAKLSSENLLGELGVAIVSPEAYEDYRQAEYWHDFMAKIARDDQLIRTVTTTASRSSSGLHVAVGEENLNSVMDLTIMGTINGMDLLVIRNKMKNLRNLDLTDANIVANDDLFDYYQGGFIKEDNELGANAFKDMNIRSVILPKSLVAINDCAFQNCGRLEKVVMTGSLETIGSNAFSYCGKLESVYISDGVKNINSGAFYGCNKLSDLHMSANVKLIGDGAFYGSAIDTIIFGDSLKTIGYEAFHDNGNLKRVSLGNGIETLEPGAFSGCYSLENVDFGNHLVNIYHGAFDGCYNLKSVILPNSVKRVDYDAFGGCRSIDTLYIGHKVEFIGERAFYGCSGIEDVTFGKSIKEIGPYAFEGCSNIKSIMLPTSLKYIRYRAFANCTGLKEFKIPSSVEKIENEAFGGNRKLESVYAYTIEPITIDQNTFSCWEYATLYVPKTSYYTYYLNKQWSQFMTLREFDEPYEYFYLNDDYLLDDETGRIDGVPDMLLNENSGIIVQGDETQQINEIELVHNGKDGASIIGGDGDVTGQLKNLTAKSMKVNIDVEGNRWYFFCFPFNVDLDSIECTSQYVFWKYDGNQRAQLGTGWTKLPEGLTALSKGEGYIFQTNRTGILTIHVESEYLTFASQTENEVLHSYAAEDVTNASWNFIGNPFISYYDTRDLAEEYDAPIITWNGRSYDVYKPGEEDEEPYQLKPFEAFFVQKASGKQSINFLPDNRLTYNQSVAAKTNFVNQRRAMGTVVNPDRLLVNLSIMDCDSVTDKTRIVYSTNASMDYEIGVDAPKFQSDGVPQLYSVAGGVKYSINERPAGNDEIKLGYVAPKAGVYTLSVPRMDADVEVYDNVLNSRVNFIDGNYDFTTKAGTFNDRFVIYKTGSSVTAIGKDIVVDGLTLHPADGGIDVSGNAAGQDVMVYLPTGALVAKLSADGYISSGLGTFIIKVGDRSVKMVVE